MEISVLAACQREPSHHQASSAEWAADCSVGGGLAIVAATAYSAARFFYAFFGAFASAVRLIASRRASQRAATLAIARTATSRCSGFTA